MKTPDILAIESKANRRRLGLISAGSIVAIALIDWRLEPNVSLGFLYVLPIVVSALFLNRWILLGGAVACAILREILSPFPWDLDAEARTLMALIAYIGAGFFVSELARNRQRAIEHGRELEEQIELRREAEEELRVLVESSPAAIVTVDAGGSILLANEAAQRLLAPGERGLEGDPISRYLPPLASVLGPEERAGSAFRTTMECIGRTDKAEPFLAHIWFSTYPTRSGPRLAAIILDASEQLRDREALSLSSLATASRILFGAVSHEVRNLSAAATVAYTNLARVERLKRNEDFVALGTLLEGLEKIASAELRLASDHTGATADLHAVLDELRVVLEPAFRETETEIEWRIEEDLPRVCGEHHSLLQVFLNLAQNSHREMQRVEERRLRVTASADGDSVVVRLLDTGPGVTVPERLFQPFQHGADVTGLGLYVSRAIVRAFAGDLRYEPQPRGCSFAVKLPRAS